MLDANHGRGQHGVFTERRGALTNDFIVNLLDLGTEWKRASDEHDLFEGCDRKSGAPRWTATSVDLI